jgi:predicted GNAT family acetyltransferase
MKNPVEIPIRDNRENHRFEAEVEGHLAIVDYNLSDRRIVVAHTEVPKPIEGRGIASALYRAVLAQAREEGRLVVPVCPVFALYVKRHAEAHDVLDPSFRRSLGLPEAVSGPAKPA